MKVTDDQSSEIAAQLGVGTDSEHVAAVIEIIRRYVGRGIAMGELPPGDHRDRDIKTLSALACAMDGLNSNVLAWLARHGGDLSACEPAHLAGAARLAAEELKREKPPAKKGRKPLRSREILFQELADIYTEATGRPPIISRTSATRKTTEGGQPSGRFFRYIRAAVAPIPKLNDLEDYALAKAVERALKKHKHK